MFAYADFIPPCSPFYFKATESKAVPQLNSNGDAIKCKKTEREYDHGDVYALQTSLCHCKEFSPHSRSDCCIKCDVELAKYTQSS